MLYSVVELAEMGVRAHHTAKVTRGVLFFGVGRIVIGEFSRVDAGCILTGDIELGKRVHLAPYCVLYGKAGIRIGDYSGFGAFTAMHSESDDYSGRSMFGPCVPPEYQPYKQRAAISIGRNVLGGTRVTMLPGVALHDGAAIGAHSLVKHDCQADTIYAGAPAKAIGRRAADIWALMRNFELGMEP